MKFWIPLFAIALTSTATMAAEINGPLALQWSQLILKSKINAGVTGPMNEAFVEFKGQLEDGSNCSLFVTERKLDPGTFSMTVGHSGSEKMSDWINVIAGTPIDGYTQLEEVTTTRIHFLGGRKSANMSELIIDLADGYPVHVFGDSTINPAVNCTMIPGKNLPK